jgi:hypothetical protein
VAIPGLPRCYFPIAPVKATFTTLLTNEDGTTSTIRVTRSQVPIQPAFAVTGQSAQGKTLPNVLACLHEGGFGAYVAASRACNREGLCITEPVTLQDLNKPLPHSLCAEVNRLNMIEHNTYIRHGFHEGTPLSVQDPESEKHIKNASFVTLFDIPDSTRKRKHGTAQQPDKEMKTHKRPRISNTTENLGPGSGGCTWTETDWSCAYDTVLMTVFYAYLSLSIDSRRRWSLQTSLSQALDQSFRWLTSSRERMMSCQEFNTIRDQMRNFLSGQDSHHFPRHGAVGAPADLIFDYLKQADNKKLSVTYTCRSSPICGPPLVIPTEKRLPTIWSTTAWNEWTNGSTSQGFPNNLASVSIQTWLEVALASRSEMPLQIPCDSLCTSDRVSCLSISNPPPLLVFEVSPGTVPTPIPCAVINVPCVQEVEGYALRGVIYLGHFHFTARLIDRSGQIWNYDGQKNGGIPYRDNNCEFTIENAQMDSLTVLDDRPAYLYVYALQNN